MSLRTRDLTLIQGSAQPVPAVPARIKALVEDGYAAIVARNYATAAELFFRAQHELALSGHASAAMHTRAGNLAQACVEMLNQRAMEVGS